MNKHIIFLSGAMRGIPRGKAIAWRKQAKKFLNSKIFKTIDAYRGRERPRLEPDPIKDPKLAVARDKQDILRSKIVLVNDSFDSKKYPEMSLIGTAMEVLFAYEHNIPVIVFGNAHRGNYFLDTHVHVRVDTLKEACDLINKLFIE